MSPPRSPHVNGGALVVSSEPTATFALRSHDADYVNTPDCSLVANAARDLGEFLVRWRADHPERSPVAVLQAGRWGRTGATPAPPAGPEVPLRIAYHQPCHLKAQQIGNPGLELLDEIPGVQVIDLAAGCCGTAGTFGMKTGTYDSRCRWAGRCSSGWPRLPPLSWPASAARVGRTGSGDRIETVHPMTLLAEAYGCEPPIDEPK